MNTDLSTLDNLETIDTQYHLVAVYGSLLTGLHNHSVMEYAEGVLLGEDETDPHFKMVSLGSFPGLFEVEEGKGDNIKIEVYKVPENGLKGPLDRLEGYTEGNKYSMYIRKLIQTKFGRAWIYLYNEEFIEEDYTLVNGGDWRTYYTENRRY